MCGGFQALQVVAACAALASQTPQPSLSLSELTTLLAEHHVVSQTPQQQTRIATAMLKAIDPMSVIAAQPSSATSSSGDVERAELWTSGIGYLKLRGLDETNAATVVASLKPWSLGAKQGVILDLRGAGGSSVSAFQAVEALFVRGEPPRVELQTGDGSDLATVLCGDNAIPLFDVPVLVLVDETTWGVSESVAAAVNTFSGVMVLGNPTMGDRALREWIAGPDGQWVYMATQWMQVGGLARGEPVMPDIIVGKDHLALVDEPVVSPEDKPHETAPPVEPAKPVVPDDSREMAAKRDPMIRRALDILHGLHVLKNRNTVGSDHVPALDTANKDAR